MSVDEWLNSVIQPMEDDADDPTDQLDRAPDHEQQPYSNERWHDHDRAPLEGRRNEQERHREYDRDEKSEASPREEVDELHGRLDALSNQLKRLTRTDAVQRRLSLRDREVSGELSDAPAPKLTGAPTPPRAMPRPSAHMRPPATYGGPTIEHAGPEITARQRKLDGPPQTAETATPAGPAAPQRARDGVSPTAAAATACQFPPESLASVLAEIAARQHALNTMPPPAAAITAGQLALDGGLTVEAPAIVPLAPGPVSPVLTGASPVPTFDVSSLERQLREITARLEELRPSSDLAQTVDAVRADLARITRQLNEALPRRALEPLESEIRDLSQRIDQSRQSGIDSAGLAALERGLTEVRDALRELKTSENLVGFGEAVSGLTHTLDRIASNHDPATLHQIETAIEALQGIVSRIASDNTLAKITQDVNSLAAKLDAFADSAVSRQDLSAVQNRIETLASAIGAATEAGHAVPQELEKLLSGLVDKLEAIQVTHSDQPALTRLEDHIAMLITRFDASDARFGQLEALERGIADALAHFERMREADGHSAEERSPEAVKAIARDVAEIRQSGRSTQDYLEAVQGVVEQVVDRLATIESKMRLDATARSMPTEQLEQTPEVVQLRPAIEPAPPARNESSSQRPSAPRPIDPNLPPDHPLEPGSTTGRSRASGLASDWIAASEAASGSAKPPVIADPGSKANFIAAARLAAKAAAGSADSQKKFDTAGGGPLSLPKKLTKRIRTLLAVGSAVLIVMFSLHIAFGLFAGGGAAPAPTPEAVSPPAATATEPDPAVPAAADSNPPADQTSAPSTAPGAPPNPQSSTPTDIRPSHQSKLDDGVGQPATSAATAAPTDPTASEPSAWETPDTTGSLAAPSTTPTPSPTSAAASVNLPSAIGGPALRAAAIAGDAAAAYEVAMRFSEGLGVARNDDEAARWFERAAKQGLAPAQFRLGTLYEKGTGVKKDLAAARDLYLAAANKGNGKAMHNLAVLYAEGINGPADYRTAAHWFRMAADRGIADSQYNLGILLARGIGVQQNFGESYKWFSLAANQGDQESDKKRDEVAAKLDAQSLTAARLAVQTWSAQPQPDEAISVKTPRGGWDKPQAAAPANSKPHPSAAKAAAPGSEID